MPHSDPGSDAALPEANSPSLSLSHPTEVEKTRIWTLNSQNWGKSIGLFNYLEREKFMANMPHHTRDGGISYWILVDRNSTPNSRPVLGSLETIRKRVFVARNGEIKETITHAIGSVFCNPDYRGRGYMPRMLKEIAPALKDWQTEGDAESIYECPFSILYSDIGKKYYAKFGWHPFPSSHIHFFPVATKISEETSNPEVGETESLRFIRDSDVEELCARDVRYITEELMAANDGKTHVALVPDYSQMHWHHLREDFMTSRIFSKTPKIRGSISGTPGNQVWAIWTRSYYGPINEIKSGNTLQFLRLVIENKNDVQGNIAKLKAILTIAQKEAAEWKCLGVEMWNPSQNVQEIVDKLNVKHVLVDREEDSIASLMWYGKGMDDVVWDNCEKYGWC